MKLPVADHYLDVSGHKCPIPVLRLRRKIEKIKINETISLKATDPLTLIDIPNFCREAGQDLINTEEDKEFILYLVKKCC